MSTDPMSRRGPMKAKQDAVAAERIDALMRDTKYDRLRSPRMRQVLAVALLAAIGAVALSFWLGHSLIATLILIVGVGLWMLLRVAVRTIADLPDEYLDERLAQVRDRSYLESYRLFATVAIVVPMVGMLWFIISGSAPDAVDLTVTIDQFQAVFWLFLGLSLSLPSIVLALRESDI